MELDRRRWFSLNQQVIGAGVREIAEIALWFDDHQVHIERLRGRATTAFTIAGPKEMFGTNRPSP